MTPPRLFLISDTHYNHINIIRYCARPFANVDIRRWNDIVAPTDHIIHLGDFVMGQRVPKLDAIASQLHGHISLILGNHDHFTTAQYLKSGITVVPSGWLQSFLPGPLTDALPPIWLSHYGGSLTPALPPSAYWLHGHSHNATRFTTGGRICNVSCEHTDYAPITPQAVIDRYARETV